MSPVGFEPTISAGERPQTYALDRATTGTGNSAVSKGQSVVTYVTSAFIHFYHFIIRETLQRHACAANSVKDVRAKFETEYC